MLFRWLVLALAILATPYIVSGVTVDSFGSALFAAAVLGVFNFLLRPILLILTLPLTVFTLGFFIFIINGLMFYWASAFVGGLHVASFGAAFFAALWVSLVSWATQVKVHRVAGGRPQVMVHETEFGSRKVRDLN